LLREEGRRLERADIVAWLRVRGLMRMAREIEEGIAEGFIAKQKGEVQ
jgi:hypothetical protein